MATAKAWFFQTPKTSIGWCSSPLWRLFAVEVTYVDSHILHGIS